MRALLLLGAVLGMMLGLVYWKVTSARPEDTQPTLEASEGSLVLGVEQGRESPLKGRAIPNRAGLGGAGNASTRIEGPGSGAEQTPPRSGEVPHDPAGGAGDPLSPGGPGAGEGGSPSPSAGGEEHDDPEPLLEPAPADPVEPPEGRGVTHEVRKGETLYSLVRSAYGSADARLLSAVAEASGLDDPGAIGVGQRLSFPQVSGFRAPTQP